MHKAGVTVQTTEADRLAMGEALAQARAAALANEVPVGAVITHNGVVIASAQNRMRRDLDPTAHSEVLAIRAAAAALGQARLSECTLYVTLEPCAMCAGAIVLSKLGRLVFGAWDDKAGMCGSVGDIVRHSRLNHMPAVKGGVEAAAAADILRTFFANKRTSADVLVDSVPQPSNF